MSTTVSSRCCWQSRHLRRLYSSAMTETTQRQARHAPIAIDLGGVEIGSSNSRQRRREDTLDPRQFKTGSLSQRLAIREIAQRQQDKPQSQTVSESQMADSTDSSHQQKKTGLYARPKQLERRQQSSQPDGYQKRRRPARQDTKPQRRPRWAQQGSDQEAQMARIEAQEEWYHAIDDDTGTVATSLVLQRADPLLPPPKPRLPPSMTMLDQEIYIDAPTRKLQEQTGGDYALYFSSKEWKLARAQSSGPLGVVDYARLALHLNRTVPTSKKAEGIEIVRKHAERAKIITSAS